MSRTAPGRRIELNGTYAGRPCVEQSEQDRVEAIGGVPASGQRDPNQDVLYPPDDEPPKDEPSQPARETSGRLAKGSPEAKQRMAELRERRGQKKADDVAEQTEEADE